MSLISPTRSSPLALSSAPPFPGALAGGVGDVGGEPGASVARTQDEGASVDASRPADTARGVPGRRQRGERCRSGHWECRDLVRAIGVPGRRSEQRHHSTVTWSLNATGPEVCFPTSEGRKRRLPARRIQGRLESRRAVSGDLGLGREGLRLTGKSLSQSLPPHRG